MHDRERGLDLRKSILAHFCYCWVVAVAFVVHFSGWVKTYVSMR